MFGATYCVIPADVIYGTIRLIEPGPLRALYLGPASNTRVVIFNLHVDHEAAAIARASSAFVRPD